MSHAFTLAAGDHSITGLHLMALPVQAFSSWLFLSPNHCC
jgi:hypothetical protein